MRSGWRQTAFQINYPNHGTMICLQREEELLTADYADIADKKKRNQGFHG